MGRANHSADNHPYHAIEESIAFQGDRDRATPIPNGGASDCPHRAIGKGAGVGTESPEVMRSLHLRRQLPDDSAVEGSEEMPGPVDQMRREDVVMPEVIAVDLALGGEAGMEFLGGLRDLHDTQFGRERGIQCCQPPVRLSHPANPGDLIRG